MFHEKPAHRNITVSWQNTGQAGTQCIRPGAVFALSSTVFSVKCSQYSHCISPRVRDQPHYKHRSPIRTEHYKTCSLENVSPGFRANDLLEIRCPARHLARPAVFCIVDQIPRCVCVRVYACTSRCCEVISSFVIVAVLDLRVGGYRPQKTS